MAPHAMGGTRRNYRGLAAFPDACGVRVLLSVQEAGQEGENAS